MAAQTKRKLDEILESIEAILGTSGAVLSAPIAAFPLVAVEASFAQPSSGGGAFTAPAEISDNASAGSASPLHFVDVVANNGDTGYIVKAEIESVSGASTFVTTNALPRLWLFNAAPTMFGNGNLYQLDATDEAKRQGFIDFPNLLTEGTGSDTGYSEDDGLRKAFTCGAASKDLWGILVAKAAYTWTNNQTWKVKLKLERT